MQIGIHLPHAGEQATPALIRRHAIRAEALGLSDVWVSEHIIVPRATFPRSPQFFDPVVTLTWVAAVTERIRLGTSVLVLPMRHPLPLAKELATLQNLSGGRLILGAGVGWLEPEFAALGVPFKERGRRMDEGIAMMRAVWSQDPVTFEAKHHPGDDRRHDDAADADAADPALAGGGFRCRAEAHDAHRRWLAWHALHAGDASRPWSSGCAPSGRGRISPSRCGWNGTAATKACWPTKIAAYAAVGVDHVMIAPTNREVDDWDDVIEGVGRHVAG